MGDYVGVNLRTLDAFLQHENQTTWAHYNGYLYPGSHISKPSTVKNPYRVHYSLRKWMSAAISKRALYQGV